MKILVNPKYIQSKTHFRKIIFTIYFETSRDKGVSTVEFLLTDSHQQSALFELIHVVWTYIRHFHPFFVVKAQAIIWAASEVIFENKTSKNFQISFISEKRLLFAAVSYRRTWDRKSLASESISWFFHWTSKILHRRSIASPKERSSLAISLRLANTLISRDSHASCATRCVAAAALE